MGKFRVTVTKRKEEWAPENAPLTEGARAPAAQTLGCQQGLDTPGYGPSLGCEVIPDTPAYADPALGCTIDTPGYGKGGPVSPLTD